MRKLVSILIPAYNAQKWIDETIQSALAQTWQWKEVIIVDDGSSDATLSVARQYESSTVKIIHQENGGACRARNRALRESQGDYIQWLDADDLLAPDKIEQQLTVAESHANPDVLFSSAWGKFYYRPNKARFSPTPLWRDLEPIEWLILWQGNRWMMHPSVWLVSRQLTDKAGLWDERLTRDQDGEYFCRVVSLSRFVKFVLKSRCYYRMANLSSVSKSSSRKAWESRVLSMDLTIRHVLARENSERTRKACVDRLNRVASILEVNAPDQVDYLHQRIIRLGGKIAPKRISMKYALIRAVIGEKNTRLLKLFLSRTHRRISCDYDRWLAKLSNHGL